LPTLRRSVLNKTWLRTFTRATLPGRELRRNRLSSETDGTRCGGGVFRVMLQKGEATRDKFDLL
jgi:hypothetical protein